MAECFHTLRHTLHHTPHQAFIGRGGVGVWAGQRLSSSRAMTVIEPGKVWQRAAQNALKDADFVKLLSENFY